MASETIFDSNFGTTPNIYRLNTIREVDGSQQPWGVSPLQQQPLLKKNTRRWNPLQGCLRKRGDQVKW
jgi:hypothetical protein